MSLNAGWACLTVLVLNGINSFSVFGQDTNEVERTRVNALLENSIKVFRFENTLGKYNQINELNAVSAVDAVEQNGIGPKPSRQKSLSIQKWTNDVRDSHSVGLLTLWVDEGRPVAVVGSYIWKERLMHEFDSLARQRFQAFENDKLIWEPSEQQVFQAVSKELKVDSNAIARMRQMKTIASSMSVTMLGWRADNSDRESLRLLPRELYRYQPENDSCIDGALFAFVLGTDPEAILAIEAVERDGQAEWEFAFIRQTSAGLSATQDGVHIWEVEPHPSRNDRTGLGFTITSEKTIEETAQLGPK
jgi:hypothetical protein